MKKMNAGEFEFHAKDRNSVAKSQNEGSITLRKIRTLRGLVFAILLTFFLLPAAAHAQPCTAVVDGGTSYTSINAALAHFAATNAIGQTGPGTITVTGTCTENVSISDARSITIVAPSPGGAGVPGGATIVGPLDNDAFDIFRSQSITLRNLEITGTFSSTEASGGGGSGVSLFDASEVRIIGCNIHDNQIVGVESFRNSVVDLRDTTIQHNTPNDGLDLFDNSTANVTTTTIQNNGIPMSGAAGVFLGRNSVVTFRGSNHVQNNADAGIQARIQSTVVFAGQGLGEITTVQGNLTTGIILEEGSHLQVSNAPHLIQGNGYGAACPLDPTCGGILATQDSHVDIGKAIVSENHGFGVSVQQGSNVRLGRTTVSNNSGDGVHIQWLSIGNFLPGTTITGNGGASIFCAGRSFALGNLSTFSSVRCGDN
jgi:hypothetical protein